MVTNFPSKEIRVMLHALGIAIQKDGNYIRPNKRYCPYPTSHRNYYQTSNCDVWNDLVAKGLAIYRKGEESWQDCYFVTEEGKHCLKTLGYRWHERKERDR